MSEDKRLFALLDALSPCALQIDWYHPGQHWTVIVDGVAVVVRFVGGKGRRGRIAIGAPQSRFEHPSSPGTPQSSAQIP